MQNIKKLPKRVIVLSLIGLLALLSILVIVFVNQNRAPGDSSAATTAKLDLQLSPAITTTNLKANDTFTVILVAQGVADASTSEIVLKFDPAVLQGTQQVEGTNLLALNKKIDNTNGTITMDVANAGPGAITEGATLDTITFSVKTVNNTVVTVDPASTLGIPNKLASGTGYGTLTITMLATATTRCGDGTVQTPNTAGVNEVCDDGNTANNDQCSSDC